MIATPVKPPSFTCGGLQVSPLRLATGASVRADWRRPQQDADKLTADPEINEMERHQNIVGEHGGHLTLACRRPIQQPKLSENRASQSVQMPLLVGLESPNFGRRYPSTRCLLLALSGLFERARRTSAFGVKAPTFSQPFWVHGRNVAKRILTY